MTIYNDSFVAPRRFRPGFLPGLIRILRWALEAYRKHRRLQRSRQALAHLDAHLLKDIGLTPPPEWMPDIWKIDLTDRLR